MMVMLFTGQQSPSTKNVTICVTDLYGDKGRSAHNHPHMFFSQFHFVINTPAELKITEKFNIIIYEFYLLIFIKCVKPTNVKNASTHNTGYMKSTAILVCNLTILVCNLTTLVCNCSWVARNLNCAVARIVTF